MKTRLHKTKYYIVNLDTKKVVTCTHYDRMYKALASICVDEHATAIKGSEIMEYPDLWIVD